MEIGCSKQVIVLIKRDRKLKGESDSNLILEWAGALLMLRPMLIGSI